MTPPIHTVNDDAVHVLTFPDDGSVLRFTSVNKDRAMRLWAEVVAKNAGGTVLNRGRFHLLDVSACVKFSAMAVAHDGQPPDDWDQRLLLGIPVVQEQVATGAGIAPTKTASPLTFPLAVFPQAIQTFVMTCAKALPCPPDFLGVPVLSQLGAAIGTSHAVEVKPGWHETARLWTAVVADPGSKKSPALNLAMQPLFRVQHDMQQQYAQARKDYETAYAVYEKDLAAWKRNKHAHADDRPEKPEEPLYPQVVPRMPP